MGSQIEKTFEADLKELERMIALEPSMEGLSILISRKAEKLINYPKDMFESSIFRRLDRLTALRETIMKQLYPVGTYATITPTCVDPAISELLSMLDIHASGAVSPDLDPLTALEKLKKIDPGTASLELEKLFNTVVRQKIHALSLQQSNDSSSVANVVNCKFGQQNSKKQMPFQTQITLEEHHKIVDNLERDCSEFIIRLDEAEEDGKALAKKVTDLEHQVFLLDKSLWEANNTITQIQSALQPQRFSALHPRNSHFSAPAWLPDEAASSTSARMTPSTSTSTPSSRLAESAGIDPNSSSRFTSDHRAGFRSRFTASSRGAEGW